jgi:putative ABC transport system permease protein
MIHPWLTIVGVVEDFPLGVKNPGFPTTRTMYQLAMPGESNNNTLMLRVQARSPNEFAPTLRRIATSINPMLQLTDVTSLDAAYADFTRDGARLAMVIVLVIGSVLLLSAAGIHALMSFTVNLRRREIGIRTALCAPARLIVTSVLADAVRQLAIGLGLGLAVALLGDSMSGHALMDGTQMLLVPATAVFMFIVGLLAAGGPVRRGLRVQTTEALRAE